MNKEETLKSLAEYLANPPEPWVLSHEMCDWFLAHDIHVGSCLPYYLTKGKEERRCSSTGRAGVL